MGSHGSDYWFSFLFYFFNYQEIFSYFRQLKKDINLHNRMENLSPIFYFFPSIFLDFLFSIWAFSRSFSMIFFCILTDPIYFFNGSTFSVMFEKIYDKEYSSICFQFYLLHLFHFWSCIMSFQPCLINFSSIFSFWFLTKFNAI